MPPRFVSFLLALIVSIMEGQSGTAYADFSQADLQGAPGTTWRIHAKGIPVQPGSIGGWTLGTVTFDASGVPSGNLTLNPAPPGGSSFTINPGGSFTMSTSGVFAGSQTFTNGTVTLTPSITGIMASSKDQAWSVATTRDGAGNPVSHVFSAFVKQVPGTSFSAADLNGTWRSFRLVSQTSGNSVWVTGTETFDASGHITSGSLTFSNGNNPTLDTGTLFSLDSSGVLTGTETNGSGATTRSFQGTMAPSKDRMVAVFTINPVSPTGYGLAVFVKQTCSTCATADLGATWHFHSLVPNDVPPAFDANFVTGVIPIESGGVVTAGNVIGSHHGEGTPLTTASPGSPFCATTSLNGTCAPDPSGDGTFKGTLTFPEDSGPRSVQLQGMLMPAKDQAIGVFSVPPGGGDFSTSLGLFALIKEVTANPTLAAIKLGAGNGSVSSSQGGFTCGNDCTEPYSTGTGLTLTGTPSDANSTFPGFTNCDSFPTPSTCSLSLVRSRYVTAAFGPTPRFQFNLSFMSGAGFTTIPAGGGTGSVTFPLSLAGYSAFFCAEDDPSPAATVVFNGPGGSNLTSATSTGSFENTENGTVTGACYFSPFISGTTNPPGGTYTTTYKAVGKSLNVPAPNTPSNKVVLLPTANVSGGTLQSIGWAYKDVSTGATLGSPPGFVASVFIYVQDLSGNFNNIYNSHDLSPTTGSPHTLTSPVMWSDVGQIGLSYRDLLGNNYNLNFVRTVTIPLTVTINGSGSVSSSPAGISCPGTCVFSFDNGSNPQLTATPGGGASFINWTGDCSGTGPTTSVFLNGAKSCTANFTTGGGPSTFTLTVSKGGNGGNGTVSSSPVGINCGGTCSFSFTSGQAVQLMQTADPGSTFAGWSGNCNGSGQVTMDAPKSCTATFNLTGGPSTFSLTVNKLGSGSGAVTSDPAGINCGATCQFSFNANASIQLMAVADSGSTFAGWGGNCNETGGILLSGNLTCTATFNSTTPVSKLFNISTRGQVGTGDNIMIGGFVVRPPSGTAKRLYIRAWGPTLTGFGVPGALADPVINVFNQDSPSSPIATNDNYLTAPVCAGGITCESTAQIVGTGFDPCTNPGGGNCQKEPVLIVTLPPNTNGYTVQVSGAAGATGVATIEIDEF